MIDSAKDAKRTRLRLIFLYLDYYIYLASWRSPR